MARTQAFTEQQVAYLESLPAVDHVTSTRITYAKDFRRRSLVRYLHGASPTALFREAGLDPKLVGYKRIERCFARWKEQAEADGTIDDDAPEEPIDANERRDGTPYGNVHGRGGIASHDASASTTKDDDMGIAAPRDRRTHGSSSIAVAGSGSGAPSPDTDVPISIGAAGESPSADGAPEDPRDLLIAQQARRIAELEQEVRELRDRR
ncbi:hypothetical protein JS528_07940 [Bifidobacterium sp. MA2]|uniref:Transposase n=1 Tax=Bifidobacterium santillanense TaxID=2809028 RepID=A0ABS5UQN6_9BIFI|nr:hypothetical protein [Bifidobacterium santillanense]MBT1173280.1 hypothetical protein [Bifidobacterium santillanense]